MGSSTGREASTDPTSWRRCRLYGRNSIRRSNDSHAAWPQMRAHDDRKDFLVGIDLILRGNSSPRQSRSKPYRIGNGLCSSDRS
jgi:hypothetical protein